MNQEERQVRVHDDGVGMSERVLTGPLLDFGTSFWASSLVQEEYPGLRSSSFRAVGRYGIGFYSTFMITDQVTVATRRWDEGMDDVRVLRFQHGLSLRPTLSRQRPEYFTVNDSTVVRLHLNKKTIPDRMVVRSHQMGVTDRTVGLKRYVALLVVGLDVDVDVIVGAGVEHIHNPVSELATIDDRTRWLRNVSLVSAEDDVDGMMVRHAGRLRPISVAEELVGLAALRLAPSTSGLEVKGHRTVGGFATAIHGWDRPPFIGFIGFPPESAKRASGGIPVASQDKIEEWADEQINILLKNGASEKDLAWATSSLSDLGVDPTRLLTARLYVGGELRFLSGEELLAHAQSTGIAIFKWKDMDHVEMNHRHTQFRNLPTLAPVTNSGFLNLQIVDGKPAQDVSLIGCLWKKAHTLGKTLKFQIIQDAAEGIWGGIDVLVVSAVEVH